MRTDERDELREHLSQSWCRLGDPLPEPIHLTEAYADLGLGAGSLPVSERLAKEICSLPLFPGMTDAELDQVATAVLAFAQASTPSPR